MDLEVIEIETVHKRGNLRYLITIRYGDLVIPDFRYIKEDGKKAYLSGPQEEFVRPDGTGGYRAVLSFKNGLREKIQALVLEEMRRRGFLDEEGS